MAEALHRHAQPRRAGNAEAVLHCRTNREKYAVGGTRRRIATVFIVVYTADIGGAPGHSAQVLHTGSRIFCSDVATSLGMHKIAHGADQRGRFITTGVAYDHRLAAAHGQPGQSRFVGHAAGQAQHIAHEEFLLSTACTQAALTMVTGSAVSPRNCRSSAARCSARFSRLRSLT